MGPINQYTTDGTWDYVYDAAGNMTEKEDTVADIKWEYGYDHMNRLVWVEKIDTDTTDVLMRADYKYDALGNRIEKAVDADGDGGGGTDTTRYSYDGFKTNGLSYVGTENWDIWADLDGDNLNEIEMRYIRGNGIDELFARHDDVGTVAWYLTDRLGSVRHMTNNSGTVQNTIAYDGFGNITSESNASFGDRYKWTGRELDVETGLQFNRARYYDSELGRWISKDPLGFDAGDSNLYRYGATRSRRCICDALFHEGRRRHLRCCSQYPTGTCVTGDCEVRSFRDNVASSSEGDGCREAGVVTPSIEGVGSQDGVAWST